MFFFAQFALYTYLLFILMQFKLDRSFVPHCLFIIREELERKKLHNNK